MRDSARVSATIELLAECEASWKSERPAPADILLHHYLKARRFIGSKDRGAIAELFYFIIRHYAALHWWTEKFGLHSAKATVISALILERGYKLVDLHSIFSGDKFSPARMSPAENDYAKALAGKKLLHPDMPDHVRYNYPVWMEKDLRESLGDNWKQEVAALSMEAPVDLRTNTLLTTREELLRTLKEEGYKVEPTPHSPLGIRLTSRAPVFTSAAFKKGWFEMQDEGSQLVSLALDAKPGEKVIDFCAGAGGKTLALAAQMKNKGRILAWDTSKKRLDQMPQRIKRAKVDNVQRHIITSEHDAFIKRHKDSADAVLIDAPCSGCGTWRRNPDLKWRFHEAQLQEILVLQKRIFESAARLVKKGGRILYVTCSFLQNENERQVETFLNAHQKFRVVSLNKVWNNDPNKIIKQGGSLRLMPHQDGTDGFFASLLQRDE